MDQQKRLDFQQRFLQRLLDRRPQDTTHYEATLQPKMRGEGVISAVEAVAQRSLALETIVRRERPVLFVRNGQFDTDDVIALGPEATDLVGRIKSGGTVLRNCSILTMSIETGQEAPPVQLPSPLRLLAVEEIGRAHV